MCVKAWSSILRFSYLSRSYSTIDPTKIFPSLCFINIHELLLVRLDGYLIENVSEFFLTRQFIGFFCTAWKIKFSTCKLFNHQKLIWIRKLEVRFFYSSAFIESYCKAGWCKVFRKLYNNQINNLMWTKKFTELLKVLLQKNPTLELIVSTPFI